MRIFDKNIRKYKRHTKRLLACPKKDRRRLLDNMERDLQHFLEENPSAGHSDVVAFFGSPEELAQTYLDGLPQKELSNFKHKKNFIVCMASIIIIAFLLGAIALLLFKLNGPIELKKIYIDVSMERDYE